MKVKWTIFIVIVVFMVPSLFAKDLGIVTLKNDYQATVVKHLFDEAFVRFDNNFLVSLNSNQALLLSRAGIEYKIIKKNINPSDFYILRPQRGQKIERSLRDKLGDAVALGEGVLLVDKDNYLPLSTSEQMHWLSSPLSELKVRFYYLPQVILNSFSLVTDFPTDTLVNRVSQDSIYAWDTRLEAFQTRYIWSDSINAARDWIVQKLLSWGYTDVSTPSFQWGGSWHYNVMAVKPGYAEPDKVIVVGGHYDSITYGQVPGPMTFAPGADDNGSGTTTTLELARVLADVPLRKTVIFMAFSAEEVGLVGSQAAAQAFVDEGTDIEVMYNFDMVGFDPNSRRIISISGSHAYNALTADAAERVTNLAPSFPTMGGSSDHYSFYQQGFNVVDNIEGDFNYAGWHTNLDLSSRLNFPYFTEVVKMGLAAIAVVANSAHPTIINNVVDQGDGQSLGISWNDCDPDYHYKLYYGTTSGIYTDSVDIPNGLCSYIVNGLTEGVTYYFSIIGSIDSGYPAIYAVEKSGVPYVIPRHPEALTAEPGRDDIILDWDDNKEADFAFYRIYRDDSSGFYLYMDNVTSSKFVDSAVTGQVAYRYKITAVDKDFNESDFSLEVTSYAGTFDGGIIVVDEIGAINTMPSQTEQERYFDTLFSGRDITIYSVDTKEQPLTKNTAGRYSPLFWFDDDLNSRLIEYSDSTLSWYANFSGNNMFVSGFRTISFWTSSSLEPGDVLYDVFGLLTYKENPAFDFMGAKGNNGWPSVLVDTTNIFGNLPDICKLTPRSGATVIYTFDSFTDDPNYEGKPCGILYNTSQGKRILLGFPLYFLTRESAINLINHAVSLFGEPVYLPGDINGSDKVDIGDVTYLINYMFLGGPPPLNFNAADVDGSCRVNISDMIYLINYLFNAPQSAAPLPGCVY